MSPREVYRLYSALREVADGLKRIHGVRSLYSRSLFEELVIAATTLASARKLI